MHSKHSERIQNMYFFLKSFQCTYLDDKTTYYTKNLFEIVNGLCSQMKTVKPTQFNGGSSVEQG